MNLKSLLVLNVFYLHPTNSSYCNVLVDFEKNITHKITLLTPCKHITNLIINRADEG